MLRADSRSLTDPLFTTLKFGYPDLAPAYAQQYALTQFELIEKANPNSLIQFRDTQDRTIFMVTIDAGNKPLSKKMLNAYDENDDFIFAKDNFKRNAFWYAVKTDNTYVIKKLMEKMTHHAVPAIAQSWFDADKAGNTPLHMAVSYHGRLKTIKLLLDKLASENLAKMLINKRNMNGDTALHLSFKIKDEEVIAALLNHGAEINAHNDKNETPLSAFTQLSNEKRLVVFNLLNQQTKQAVINAFYLWLVSHFADRNDNPVYQTFKNIYLQLLCITNLYQYLLALHNFDLEMPLRNTYKVTKRVYELNDKCQPCDIQDQNGHLLVTHNEAYLDEDIADRMIFYKRRLLAAAGNNRNTLFGARAKPQSRSSQLLRAEDSMFVLLEEDRIMLNRLIDELTETQTSILSRPHVTYMYRILFPLIELMVVSSYVIAVTASFDDPKFNQILLFGGGIFELGIFMTLATMTCKYWNAPCDVSRREWNNFLGHLQDNVVVKLNDLKSREREGDLIQSLLPTDQQTLSKLNECVNSLQRDLPLAMTISNLQAIKILLEKIKFDMNRSNKPISSLRHVQEVRIEIDENEENVPLLSNRLGPI